MCVVCLAYSISVVSQACGVTEKRRNRVVEHPDRLTITQLIRNCIMATEHSTNSASNITLADQIHAAALKIAADFTGMEDRLQGFALVAIGTDSTSTCSVLR